MFSHLTSELRDQVDTVQRVLTINEGLRDLLVAQHRALDSLPADLPAGADDVVRMQHVLNGLRRSAPTKLDWQIYDHCAALTRLYSIYDQFIGELVAEYLLVLPKMYPRYSDLPEAIRTQHRLGIGEILLKIGQKGRYKDLEEEAIVRDLAVGLSGATGYRLLDNAFFTDRQNLRLDILVRLFSSLGFDRCALYINQHPSVKSFIREERLDNSSAEKELNNFIEYRNEAAHREVDNILALDEIGAIGRFLIALAEALAEMVKQGVALRRMELGHYLRIMNVSEVHHSGYVVIGIPASRTTLTVGDELIVCGKKGSYMARVKEVQLNGQTIHELIADGGTEVGVRLSHRAPMEAELRRVQLPSESPVSIQLVLEDILPTSGDVADTDVADAAPPEQQGDVSDEPGNGTDTEVVDAPSPEPQSNEGEKPTTETI